MAWVINPVNVCSGLDLRSIEKMDSRFRGNDEPILSVSMS